MKEKGLIDTVIDGRGSIERGRGWEENSKSGISKVSVEFEFDLSKREV